MIGPDLWIGMLDCWHFAIVYFLSFFVLLTDIFNQECDIFEISAFELLMYAEGATIFTKY